MTAPVVVRSRLGFADTVERLTQAITASGNTLFAALDQRAAAVGAGLTLRPTTLLIFGNPRGGTPLMEAFPLCGLDLPLKLLIWDDGAAVNVAYTRPIALVERYDISGHDELLANLERALSAAVSSVT